MRCRTLTLRRVRVCLTDVRSAHHARRRGVGPAVLGACGPLLLAAAAAAQPCTIDSIFTAPFLSLISGLEPGQIELGDFNADGHLDFAVLNTGGASVGVRLGLGGGLFSQQQTIALGATPNAMVIADLDGDGRDDLAVTTVNGEDFVLRTFTALPNGKLVDAQTIPLHRNSLWIDAGDLNGDGRIDLVTAHSGGPGDGTLGIFLAEAGGGYLPRQDVHNLLQARTLTLADFNNDGVLDIITGHIAGAAPKVHLGVGDGTFLPYITTGSPYALERIAVADLNGNGILDIVGSLPGTSNFVVTGRGNGDGTLQSFGVSTFSAAGLRNAVVGDLNGNGILDIVSTHENANVVGIKLGTGNATFGTSHLVAAAGGPRFVALGDLDGDGDLDLVVSCRTEHQVRVYLNQCLIAPSILQQPVSIAVSRGQSAQFSIVAAGGTPPLTYQWFRGEDPLDDGPGIAGAHSPSLSISPARVGNAGIYRVVVSGPGGSVSSGPAVLGVIDPCPADLNGDGILDFFDVQAYLSAFSTGCQ